MQLSFQLFLSPCSGCAKLAVPPVCSPSCRESYSWLKIRSPTSASTLCARYRTSPSASIKGELALSATFLPILPAADANFLPCSAQQKDVLPLLKKLVAEDPDIDVKYFSEQAIKSECLPRHDFEKGVRWKVLAAVK